MFDTVLGWFGTSTDEISDAASGAAEEYVKSKWKEGFFIGLIGGFVAARLMK